MLREAGAGTTNTRVAEGDEKKRGAPPVTYIGGPGNVSRTKKQQQFIPLLSFYPALLHLYYNT